MGNKTIKFEKVVAPYGNVCYNIYMDGILIDNFYSTYIHQIDRLTLLLLNSRLESDFNEAEMQYAISELLR